MKKSNAPTGMEKISLNLPKEIIEKLDKSAESNYRNRSQQIIYIVAEYYNELGNTGNKYKEN